MSADDSQDELPRLSDFLRLNRSEIIAECSSRLRALSPARELSERAIVDVLPRILERIADMTEAGDTQREATLEEVPKQHAANRLQRGFDLDEIVMEYGLLRRTILDIWEARVAGRIALSEVRQFHAAFDESVKQSAIQYPHARKKLLRALDRVSETTLTSANLDPFLENLLEVVLDGTQAVDSCAILLREGDLLRAHAAVGLEQDVVDAYSLKIGEGFAGHVAQQRRPITLRHASADPIVTSPVIRRAGMRALYGVPMLRDDDLIGVAHIGSKSAFEFSEEDKLLFRSAVSRATSGVLKARAISELQRTEAAQRFLSDAGHEFSKSLDFEATLIKIAHLAVPAIADWCVVHRREADRIRRVSAAHADPAKTWIAQTVGERYAADPKDEGGVAQVFRTAKTAWLAEVPDANLAAYARDAEHLAMLRAVGMKSVVIVPVAVQGEVNCTITLVTAESGRRYSQSDVQVAEQLADRAAAALENARLYAIAQHAISVREQILATVAHDLRNQLMIIGTGAALLSQPDASAGTDRIRKIGERIIPTIGTIRRLLDDLLDTGAIEAGKLSLQPQSVSVREVLNEAFETCRPAAHESGLELKIEPADTALHVDADPTRIMQVLSNLLGNAMKFTPRGGTVGLRADAEGLFVKFAVSDTGPGISKSDLATLFEPYRTVEHRVRTGSGLGLYIAKGIVVQHGGHLWAASEPGKGSSFCFTLPRASRESGR
ncbi:MAG TPA: ATP-binding protein [Micropepsaceae bacterium]|nr:ATP-binding protein [Micropepsaceae bacterium]